MNGKINIYHCQTCACDTVTIDIDAGVTPFMLDCKKTEGCPGPAYYSFYTVPDPAPKPEWEWFEPRGDELKKLHPAMLEHVKAGGLDLRRRLP